MCNHNSCPNMQFMLFRPHSHSRKTHLSLPLFYSSKKLNLQLPTIFFLSSRKNWRIKSQTHSFCREEEGERTDATQFRVNCSQVSLSAYVKWFPLFPRRISYGQMCCTTISAQPPLPPPLLLLLKSFIVTASSFLTLAIHPSSKVLHIVSNKY